MGVEPTDDGVTRRPPVLKTGTITGTHALPSCSQIRNASRFVILSEAKELCIADLNT